MDMSFANQALSAEYMVAQPRLAREGGLRRAAEIDASIARLKLQAMGIEIDTLTAEQEHYLTSWEIGT